MTNANVLVWRKQDNGLFTKRDASFNDQSFALESPLWWDVITLLVLIHKQGLIVTPAANQYNIISVCTGEVMGQGSIVAVGINQ